MSVIIQHISDVPGDFAGLVAAFLILRPLGKVFDDNLCLVGLNQQGT